MPIVSLLADAELIDPQLSQSLWILGIFVVVALILYKTAWKNVLTGLKAREDRIRSDIAAAEESRKKAELALVQYNQQLTTARQQVNDMISQATIDAERIATGIKVKAQQDAEEAKERATKEIETAKNQALTEIYDQTANLATAIAEKIIKKSLNANDQRELVDQSLKQLASLGNN